MSDWRKLNPLFRGLRKLRDAWVQWRIDRLLAQVKRTSSDAPTVHINDEGDE